MNPVPKMAAAAAASPLLVAPPGVRYASLFWDCRLSQLEKWILPAAVAITMMLQVKAILYSALALPLIVLMAVLCWMTPITGFFYIACAQFLPFPEGMALNPAQIGVATWLLVALVQHRKVDLSGLGSLWPVLPWLLWFWLITGEAIYHYNSEYFKAITYSVIACQQVNVAKGKHLKCLLGMCLGTLMATTAFWAYEMGFGVDLSTWGGERSGFARLGGVRADAVMIWPPLLMGCFGVLGLTLSAMVSNRYPDQVRRLKALTIGAFFISVPPLVATMTHGAYAGFALMSVCVVLIYLNLQRLRIIKPGQSQVAPVVLGMVALMVLMYTANLFQTRDRIDALFDYYKRTSDQYGAAASRSDVWEYSLKTIRTYPLLGRRFNNDVEDIPPEYAASGDYLSHNVFLDYGRATGIPGLVLVAVFFFFPMVKLWQRPDSWRFIGFFLFHLALLIFWMSLSFQFYKTFWGFWMLAAMVAEREPVALPFRKLRSGPSFPT